MIYRNRELKVGGKLWSTVQGEVIIVEIDDTDISVKDLDCIERTYDLSGKTYRLGPCCLFYLDEFGPDKYPPEPVKKYQWVVKSLASDFFLSNGKYATKAEAQEKYLGSEVIEKYIPPEERT